MAEDVVNSTLVPIADAADGLTLTAFRPSDGQFDFSAISEISGAASDAAAVLDRSAIAIDDLDRSVLVGPLQQAVDQVGEMLREARGSADAITRAATLLPAMLGTDGPRNYLVLFQNNAEWRSLGGIPGAMAVIQTEGGAIALAAQETTSGFPRYDAPVLPLDDEIIAIYGERPGRWMQNVTQVPDFSVAGALAREMWSRQHGLEVDGVLSVDPVALSYLLKATGPVTLASGDVLNSANAVSILLNEVYVRFEDPAAQDAFFAEAAAAVFTALLSDTADPPALMAALTRAADERRLMLWSAHEEDQTLLEGTTLAGGLPVNDEHTARFGVYLNDGTGSKMDYYLTSSTDVVWESCAMSADGASGEAALTIQLYSEAPADAASLPGYITGRGIYGVPPGTARTLGYAYLPEGFELIDAQSSTGGGFGGGTHEGRRVVSFTVDLAPGQSATLTVRARSATPSAPNLMVQSTPTLSPPSKVVAACLAP
ncbi:DUF4012 domain-containing protein [Microbacterium sp. NPDC055910]|uniref:DUF4012 domain-containing protein n=1 Tax=Microbacterium sp. NPDC055910 TaxID=3345659 RepID=UPI0035E2B604